MILTIWLYDHHHYKNITSYLYGLFYSWLSMIFVLAIFYIKVFIFFNNKVSYVTTMFVCLFEFFKNSDWLMNSWKPEILKWKRKFLILLVLLKRKSKNWFFLCLCVFLGWYHYHHHHLDSPFGCSREKGNQTNKKKIESNFTYKQKTKSSIFSIK